MLALIPNFIQNQLAKLFFKSAADSLITLLLKILHQLLESSRSPFYAKNNAEIRSINKMCTAFSMLVLLFQQK